MKTVITFAPDGTARCLWTEAVPLHKLGRLEINRASNIDFDNARQQWVVKDRNRKVRFFSGSRIACQEWEQQNLQPEEPNTVNNARRGPSIPGLLPGI